jgi:hypothetical protein
MVVQTYQMSFLFSLGSRCDLARRSFATEQVYFVQIETFVRNGSFYLPIDVHFILIVFFV